MPRSLLLVSLLLLAAWPAQAFDAAAPHTVVRSGRSGSSDHRDAWFSKAVGDILEGRVAERASSPSAKPK